MVVLLVSVCLNLAVFSLDTVPFLWPKIQNKFVKKDIISEYKAEETIVLRSLEMINDESITVWSDHKGFTETVLTYLSTNNQLDFKTYNYPKAFLYYGLSTYLIKNGDSINLIKVKNSFDKLIDKNGNPIFKLDKLDQVPFGLTALNFYKIYNQRKYLNFSNILYSKINEFSNKEGIVLYRKNDLTLLNDVIGMVVPFLVEYSVVLNNHIALVEAKKQLDFYVKYGTDKETFLPTHGINLSSKVKVGPANWGRGIGWYFLGLSQYHLVTNGFEREIRGLELTLNSLKNKEGLWSQFPGSSDIFDASTSTMFLYCMNNEKSRLNKKKIIDRLRFYISDEGVVNQTSGDTYNINDYSKTFGESELSQGMLLLLLSKY